MNNWGNSFLHAICTEILNLKSSNELVVLEIAPIAFKTQPCDFCTLTTLDLVRGCSISH